MSAEAFFAKIQKHLERKYCLNIFFQPSPTSGFNFEGSHPKNYNASSVVVWAEMSDATFSVCQQYGTEA